ncbi:MAG: serine/threonine protein kinase, partial [Candidatus Xenobia bacterium]
KNSYYFVMEYVEGIDLGHYLEDHGSPGLPAAQVIDWSVQMLSALEYLHELKPPIVHRDIKPSNILYRPDDGRVLLIDFGIARVTNPAEGYWIGTPGYAPIEQQFGKHEPRSDLHALAASMHELLTGKRPDTDTLDFPTFQELGVAIDPKLEEVIGVGLARFPEDRHASAHHMREALEQVPGWAPTVPSVSTGFTFSAAVQEVKAQIIDPLLKDLIARYRNECLTPFLPPQLEYLVFTLGMQTPFELIIKRNDREEKLEFYEKQGILERVRLGQVDPRLSAEVETIAAMIDTFCSDYEQFKFSI